MIGKSEGLHAWTPPGAGTPAVELGRVRTDLGATLWPRFVLDRVTGLGAAGDPEDNRDRPPGRALETPRRSTRRGKTVTYEGRIKARSLHELREAEDTLLAAFDDLTAEGRMDVTWHPLLLAARPEFAAETPKFYEARALTCDVVDVQTSERWERLYVVGLRMSDRRYFDEATEAHTVEIKLANTSYKF